MKTLFAALSGLALASGAFAQSRTSASYAVAADTIGGGGHRGTSASYTHDGAIGGIGGIATAAAPAKTAKHGYIGQLYEVAALALGATPTTVAEGATRQLAGTQLLDDTTTLAVPAAAIAWSVVGGPISGIGAGGLATAGPVYQNTPATVQGIHAGLTGTLGLTVLNTGTDDFLAYGGDGLDDGWQVLYFGQPPNAVAGPAADPDGDGRDNLLEYYSGYSPADGAAFFLFHIDEHGGNSASLRLSKVIPGTMYSLQRNDEDLNPDAWRTLETFDSPTEEDDFRVADPAATGPRMYYRVELSR